MAKPTIIFGSGFETLEERYPPDAHDLFVTVGARDVNCLRAAVWTDAKQRGYAQATDVSHRATTCPDLKLGDNCSVFKDTIPSFVASGNDVVLWSRNHISHHSSIGDHCFVTSHVAVSGDVSIEPRWFLGVNATVWDGITIAEGCVIGAGALVMRSTEAGQVFVSRCIAPDARSSDDIGL